MLKKYLIVLEMFPWSALNLEVEGKKQDFVVDEQSKYFMVVYEEEETLRAEFPEAAFTEIWAEDPATKGEVQ